MNDLTRFYDRFAGSYESYYVGVGSDYATDRFNSILLDFSITKAAKILELGCGTGRCLLEWLELGYAIDGVDSSTEMLKIAHSNISMLNHQPRYSNVRLYNVDVTDPNMTFLVSRKYDVAVAHFNFVNVFDAPALNKIFRNVSRILLPGGLFIAEFVSQASPTSKLLHVSQWERRYGLHRIEWHERTRCLTKIWKFHGSEYRESYFVRHVSLMQSIAAFYRMKVVRRQFFRNHRCVQQALVCFKKPLNETWGRPIF